MMFWDFKDLKLWNPEPISYFLKFNNLLHIFFFYSLDPDSNFGHES